MGQGAVGQVYGATMGQVYGTAMGQRAMGQLWGGAAMRGMVHCRWTRITSSSYGVDATCQWYGATMGQCYGTAMGQGAMGQLWGAMGRCSNARQRALQVDEDYIQQRWSRALWGREL